MVDCFRKNLDNIRELNLSTRMALIISLSALVVIAEIPRLVMRGLAMIFPCVPAIESSLQ